jgi:hypothetical protein
MQDGWIEIAEKAGNSIIDRTFDHILQAISIIHIVDSLRLFTVERLQVEMPRFFSFRQVTRLLIYMCSCSAMHLGRDADRDLLL